MNKSTMASTGGASKQQKRDLDIAAILWVKRLPINGKSLKPVLLGLALESKRHRGHTCYPGQQLIADNVGVGVRTVRDAITELAQLGLIKVEPRRTTRGSKSYLYTLNLPAATADSEKAQPAKSVNPTGKICTEYPTQPAATADEGKNSSLSKKENQIEEIAGAPATLPNGTKNKDPLQEEISIDELFEELCAQHHGGFDPFLTMSVFKQMGKI